ncbi:DUF4870 domain-containing protein [Longispora sp. K20-0274]|uniref:DUF4870 domain-containing protein n=1 Tax=Longispora sp. K20-0274 TaxID=3088255 RepID=UPI00399B48FA
MADNDPDFPVTGPPWNPQGPAAPPGGYQVPPPGYRMAPPPFQRDAPGTGYGHGGPADPSDPAYSGPRPNRQEIADSSLTHFLGLLGILGPILMYALKGPTSRWVKANASESLNFHISMIFWSLGWVMVSFVAACGLGLITHGAGFFLAFALMFVPVIVSVTFSVLGGITANKGEFYRYPLTIRMIKG